METQPPPGNQNNVPISPPSSRAAPEELAVVPADLFSTVY